eukprot:2917481-Pleurochrysis_carterae.AAC.1
MKSAAERKGQKRRQRVDAGARKTSIVARMSHERQAVFVDARRHSVRMGGRGRRTHRDEQRHHESTAVGGGHHGGGGELGPACVGAVGAADAEAAAAAHRG